MKKPKTKKRNYFSIVVCKAGDIDGYHVSVLDMDSKRHKIGSVFNKKFVPPMSNYYEISAMIGRFALDLMEFKV